MTIRPLIAAAILFKPGLVCVPHGVPPVDTDATGSTAATETSTSGSSSSSSPSTSDTTMTTSVEAVCGDGVADPGEECDDGNQASDDACLITCKNAVCGDDVVWQDMEECDDGDADDHNACTAACKNAVCGDGIVWTGMEECDDGNNDDTDRCTSQCKLPVCGDGILGPEEICDNGVSNVPKDMAKPDECTTECKIACGDLTVSSMEECDDGGAMPGDGCSPMCVNEYIIFATNELHPADFGGIAGADEICQMAAMVGNLTGTYVAWLSAGADSAKSDLPIGKAILRTDGQVVVNTAEDLIQGPMTSLLHPINLDEEGGAVTGYAWTGTSTLGTFTGADCTGWTVANASVTNVGFVASLGAGWTNEPMVDPKEQIFCDATNHLYCLRVAKP